MILKELSDNRLEIFVTIGVDEYKKQSLQMSEDQNSLKVIYDVGANNGDDIEYYLKKADLVVAIEANPALCRKIEKRFSEDISNDRLVLLNNAVTDSDAKSSLQFYVHREFHYLSSLEKPAELEKYYLINVAPVSLSKVIKQYGNPYYVKIDIEGHDAIVLRDLLDGGHKPPYLSVESHSAEIFAILLAIGRYQSFNLIDGASVGEIYKNHRIQTNSGSESFAFKRHSAGPFGEDIKGSWLSPEDFHYALSKYGFGWRDIHVTTEISPKEPEIRLTKNASLRMRIGKAWRSIRNRLKAFK